jgi:hypothetical protein
MNDRWTSRPVSVPIPRDVARAMWHRARYLFDVMHGGRFDARSQSTILLWSAPLHVAGAQAIGAITLAWGQTADGEVDIVRVAWLRSWRGGEAQVWRAIEVLAGDDATLIPLPARVT